MKSKAKSERKKRAAVRVQRVVRRRFTVHDWLGNWLVRMTVGKESRMLCFCTRKPDAECIAAALNTLQFQPPNEKADRPEATKI